MTADPMVNVWNRLGVNGADVTDPYVSEIQRAARDEGLVLEMTIEDETR